MKYPTIPDFHKLFLACSGVSIDTRKVKPDGIFFALKGQHVDGHEYLEAASQAGASYLIISDITYYKADQGHVVVEDVITFMQDLARYHRDWVGCPLIALTGSNGKTTTKELIAVILSKRYKLHFTQGNFNNHLGVPLTLLAMQKDCELALIEMGANHMEEIDFLCKIAKPNFGLITNIGSAHLEGFGSLDNIAKAKSELLVYLNTHGGSYWQNMSETSLILIEEYLRHDSIEIGHKSEHDTYIIDQILFTIDHELKFKIQSSDNQAEGQMKIYGNYNIPNVIYAVALGLHFKVGIDHIAEALESYLPTNNRSQVIHEGTNTYVLDAYNANPDSMRKAITSFNQIVKKNKWIILGDMYELGDYSNDKHLEILQLAREMTFDKIVLVGPGFGVHAKEGEESFEDIDQAKEWWTQTSKVELMVLFKGSRGIALEKILEI